MTARHPDFPQAFTRTRKLPLPGLIAALLSQRGQSQQVTLDSIFASLCDSAQPVRGPSPTALVAKARDRLYMPAAATAASLRATGDPLITDTLRDCQGNITQAARRLGVSRGLLYRRLQRRAGAD